MKLTAPTPKTGIICSACGATVVISPTLRSAKMQCPKCRAVIALPRPVTAGAAQGVAQGASAQGEPTGKAVPEPPDTAHLEARLSSLEARVTSLELASEKPALSELTEHPAPVAEAVSAVEIPEPAQSPSKTGGNGHSAAAETPEKTEASGPVSESLGANGPRENGTHAPLQPPAGARSDADMEERMTRRLVDVVAGKVAIRVKEGDPHAFQYGEWLGRVFLAAGWTVTTFEARPMAAEEQQLTLAISGNFPYPKWAPAIQGAFAAAGLDLAFGIDPASDSPIPILLVPRRPAGDIPAPLVS